MSAFTRITGVWLLILVASLVEARAVPFYPISFGSEYRTHRYVSPITPFPRGDILLGGIPFWIPDTGNYVATTYDRTEPAAPTSFTLSASVPDPTDVYFLLNTGWSWQSLAGTTIGDIAFFYDDGSS